MPQVRTLAPDGERIRALRLEQGLTVIDLCKRTRRSRATIYRLEAGTPASEVLIHQVANALSVRATEITQAEAA